MKLNRFINLFYFNNAYYAEHDPNYKRCEDVDSELFIKSNYPFAKRLLMFIKVASMKDEDFLNVNIEKKLIEERSNIENISINDIFKHIQTEFIYLSTKVVEFNIKKFKENSMFSETIIKNCAPLDKKKHYNAFKELFYVFVINNYMTLEEMFDVTILYPRVEDGFIKKYFDDNEYPQISEYEVFRLNSKKFNKEYFFEFKYLFNQTFYK